MTRSSSSIRKALRAKNPSSGWCRLPSSSVITTTGSTTSCSAKRRSAPRVGQQHAGVDHVGPGLSLSLRMSLHGAPLQLTARALAPGPLVSRWTGYRRSVQFNDVSGPNAGAPASCRAAGSYLPSEWIVNSHERASRCDGLPHPSLERTYDSRRRSVPRRHARTWGDGWMTSWTWSGAVTALAQGVGPHRAQEVDPPEVRPVGLTEVELRPGALPQQEAAESLLPRGADHQVGIGLALGVEVVGDVARRRGCWPAPRARCPSRRARRAATGRRR